MNGSVKIIGGNKLSGTITPIPNKNSILPALIVSLLTDDEVIYENVPDSTDVNVILELLKKLGASISKRDEKIIIRCNSVNSHTLDKDLGTRIRATILFAGPLLVRFGIAKLPVPGGCTLGRRSISAHIDVFQKAGIEISYDEEYVTLRDPQNNTQDKQIWMNEASVTATENILMFSAGKEQEITIYDTACEPHVVDIMNLLADMGANIEGKGSNKNIVKGSSKLNGAVFTPRPDFVDIAGYIVAAAITKGQIKVKGGYDLDNIGVIKQWFEKFNIDMKNENGDLMINGDTELKIDYHENGFPIAGENLPKIYPRPWPGFPVDVLPVVVTLASKTKGRLLVNNWMYESGLDFVRELNIIGADIFVAGPQRIVVNGPVNFRGGEITSPTIIQACKALLLAALADPVETKIHGTDILKRRYPDIFTIYKSLGADIELI